MMNTSEIGNGQASGTSGTGGVLYAELSYAVVGAAIEVHRALGPGQLEATYQRAMETELELRGIEFRAQAPIRAEYKGCAVGEFLADLVVEDRIIVELKAVSALQRVHRAQVISYLKASGLRLGIVINFHVAVLVHGVRRVVG